MIYTLTFKHRGESYSIYQINQGKSQPKQYEAVAVGLILQKIDQEKLSRQDLYTDLCLIESDNTAEMTKVVWEACKYYPYSVEVK